MAKEAMRAWQAGLAERMQAARFEESAAAWLAVECLGQGLLLPLTQAGEIFPATPPVPLAHSQPWFVGVTSLRGRLHGVVDLGAFLGLQAQDRDRAAVDAVRDQRRYVGFGAAIDINCALRVDRLCGLRQLTDLHPVDAQPQARPPFAGDAFRDAAGRSWQALDLAQLAAHDAFLSIPAGP